MLPFIEMTDWGRAVYPDEDDRSSRISLLQVQRSKVWGMSVTWLYTQKKKNEE